MMSRPFWSVTLAVAWRVLHNVFTTPSLLLPGLIFPLFFFTAFAGGLSRVDSIPGFDFPPGYTAFQFVFVLLQSAAFGGVFTGFGVARDFEYGFARRLMLAAPRRSGIIAGYALAAVVRWSVTAALLTVVAFVAGMNVVGSGVDVFALYTLALIVSLAGTLWATGVAMRLRTVQAGPIMQLPVFLALFFAPVYVPARPAQRLARGRRLGQPDHPLAGGRPQPDRGLAHRRGPRVPDRDRPRDRTRVLGSTGPALGRARRGVAACSSKLSRPH